MELTAQVRGELDKVIWAPSAQQIGNFEELQVPQPLAAYSAPRPPPTVTRCLLHLPPSLQAPVPKAAVTVLASGHHSEALPTTARDAKYRGLHLCAWPTGSDTGDRHCRQESGNRSLLPPGTSSTPL